MSEIGSTDENCRILVISSSTEGGVAFIERLKVLSSSRGLASTSATPRPSTTLSKSSSEVPLTIPWTITNRYYNAEVHFSVCATHLLFSQTPSAVFGAGLAPAVVYVWREGEAYLKPVEELAKLMNLREYEPEVALAVRIPQGGASSESAISTSKSAEEGTGGDEDENGDIDSTFMSYGFEYVDATRTVDVDASGKRIESEDEDDIPALPRVLDALSTIMWPSMRSGGPSGNVGRGGKTLDLNRSFDLDFEAEDDDGLREEHDEIMHELLESTVGASRGGFLGLGKGSESQDEAGGEGEDEDEDDKELMKEMKRLVQEAERKSERSTSGSKKKGPWISTSGLMDMSDEVTMSPTGMDGDGDLLSPFGTQGKEKALKSKVSLRFDDDFTLFVSAPPVGEVAAADRTPTADFGGAPLEYRYRSLGSVSDFGGSDHGGEGPYEALDDGDDDEGMPSKAEVEDAARKIFGVGHAGDDGQPQDLSDEDTRVFDLEKVFGALQHFKSEIAGMPDDEEKRRAAAKVALGLVYGLEGGGRNTASEHGGII